MSDDLFSHSHHQYSVDCKIGVEQKLPANVKQDWQRHYSQSQAYEQSARKKLMMMERRKTYSAILWDQSIFGSPLPNDMYKITYSGWKVMQPLRGSRPGFHAVQDVVRKSYLGVVNYKLC